MGDPYSPTDSGKEVSMSYENTIGAGQRPGDPDPAAAVLAAEGFWQLPLTFYTSWWNAGVEGLWPRTHSHHPVHHDEHDQLVVPEPIEADGEHALFA
jgi:hypothetical protein